MVWLTTLYTARKYYDGYVHSFVIRDDEIPRYKKEGFEIRKAHKLMQQGYNRNKESKGEEKIEKLHGRKFILTRVKKSKEHIRLGNKDILVS